jgi:hypothetical protein
MQRRVPLFGLCLMIGAWTLPATATAQTTYVGAMGGLAGGDGGAAGVIGASASYVTGRIIGFELDFGFSPGLDLEGPEVSPLEVLFPFPEIFPPITFDVSGRLLTLQTNAIFELPSSGKMRLTVLAGGGVGHVERRVRIRQGPFPLPAPSPIELPQPDFTFNASETGLALDVGGRAEYEWTPQMAVGIDARYIHLFLNQGGMDVARVTGRVSWRF